jgi:hypothetical protein
MSGAIPPLPNTSLWSDAYLSTRTTLPLIIIIIIIITTTTTTATTTIL